MAKAYRHLTYEQRCQISVLLRSEGFISQTKIAELIGSNQSTVSREIKYNSGKRGYFPKQAHNMAVLRRHKASSSAIKLTPELEVYIESKLKLQWSPEQISGRMVKSDITKISTERIYQHIWRDKRNGGTLYKHLRRSGKKYNKRASKTAGRGLIPNCVGIEERPDIVETKKRVGDFEVDTIVGRNHRGAILSIVDRVTKLTLLVLLPRGTAKNVLNAMIAALNPFKENVLTITSDNGKEFARHEEIAKELSAGFYFAHPYCSWERGLNENTNGLVRQYLPKKTDFTTITQSDVDKIQHLLNTRPRKTLGYQTPSEVFSNATGKIIKPTYWGRCKTMLNSIAQLAI